MPSVGPGTLTDLSTRRPCPEGVQVQACIADNAGMRLRILAVLLVTCATAVGGYLTIAFAMDSVWSAAAEHDLAASAATALLASTVPATALIFRQLARVKGQTGDRLLIAVSVPTFIAAIGVVLTFGLLSAGLP